MRERSFLDSMIYSDYVLLGFNLLLKRLLIAVLSFALLSCVNARKFNDEKPVIIATTSIIADIVTNVGGEFVHMRPLISAGVDPHHYKASEGDVIRIAGADIIFHNGLGLEGKLGDVLQRAQGTVPSYAVSENIPDNKLIQTGPGAFDPHIWFDPELWSYAVRRVADALVEMDPANTIYYRKNEERYLRELLAMDKEIKEKLNTVPPSLRVLVTSHDAFSYFGRHYGWEVVGVQGVNTASETSVSSIQALAHMVMDKNVTCIFTETSVSTRSINALLASVSALGGHLAIGEALYSDSLGGPDSGADTYISMYEANTDAIVRGITGNTYQRNFNYER